MPQLKAIVPLLTTGGQVDVLHNSNSPIDKYSEQVVFTTAAFFNLFDARWLAGDATALSVPNSVVLDQQTATRFFGSWQQAMGQQLQLANTIPLQVAAVVENVPENSNFPYHLMVSFPTLEANTDVFNYYPEDWNSTSSSFQTYVLLNGNQDVAAISQQLDGLAKNYFEGKGKSTKILHLQPLSEIHFDLRYGGGLVTERMVKRSTLTTLALIGVFILLMAAINFINLSTAQAFGKGKEIGVRKVLGSSRRGLMAQSFSETFLLVFLSVVVAVGIAYAVLPYVHHFSNMPDRPALFQGDTVLFLCITLIVMTLLSGGYPALILSRFTPVAALRNKINSAEWGGISVRKGLVVTQFAIAQLLMIGTLVAVKQMAFIRNADLGFDKEALYVVQMPSDDSVHRRMDVFKQQLLQVPKVSSVSLASDVPSSDNKWLSNFYYDGNESDNITFPTFLKFGDADYFDNYGLTLLAGRPYAASDTLREAVINETMRQKLGLSTAEEAIGKRIRIGFRNSWMTISGVVKDFTPNSLREEVGPMIMATDKSRYYVAGIKLEAGAGKNTLTEIQQRFEQLYPEHYYQADFLDDSIAQFYEQEEKMALVYQLFAILSLVISSIGLYGMVSFMLGQKVKEIGIRKVLGASVASIVYLFSKEFIYMVALAFCVAAPLAYYFMHNWLANFTYRIDLGVSLFVMVILSALLIALLTIGIKAFRAAVANPVDSLRDE